MRLKSQEERPSFRWASLLQSADYISLHFFDAVDEGLQLAAAAGVAQLAQGLGFDLADALAGDLEALADLFEGVLGAVFEAEAHLDDALFARGQGAQHLRGVLLEVDRDDGVGGGDGHAVFDEVAEVRVFLFADRRFERDGLLRDLEHLADLRDGDVHAPGDLFRGGFATELLHQLTAGADELVDGLDHVHRDADGAGLVRDGAGDGLTDPPGGVGREFVTATVLELVDGLHQADVALLNQVEELQAAVGVLLGDGDDEAKVGLDQLALGALGVHVALDHLALGALEVGDGDAGVGFDALEVDAAVLLLARYSLRSSSDLRGLELGFERLDLALERAHGVDGLVDLVEQALLLAVGVLQLADDAVDVDVLAADEPAVLALILGLGLGILAARARRASPRSAASFFWCLTMTSMRPTVARTRACRISSVSSSSSKVTTSLMLRTPRRRSSPRPTISRMTMGEREMAFMTRSWPRSMRLAISTSPSRVSSGTVPISRRYMRTGSLVFSSVPGERSSSTSSDSSPASGSYLSRSPANCVAGEDVDALGVDGGHQVVEVVGRGDVTGQQVVDLAIGEIALFFPGVDELVYVVFVLVDFFSHGCAHSCE